MFLYVSEPYNRMLFTFELKILSFVLLEITHEFHVFFSKLKATCALLILNLISSSVPPLTLTVLPRYTNDEISSRFLSLILIGLLDAQLIFMILVYATFAFSPSLAEFSRHPCSFVLHLMVVARDECDVICKVKIIKKLLLLVPLDAGLLVICCLLHCPIDHQQE